MAKLEHHQQQRPTTAPAPLMSSVGASRFASDEPVLHSARETFHKLNETKRANRIAESERQPTPTADGLVITAAKLSSANRPSTANAVTASSAAAVPPLPLGSIEFATREFLSQLELDRAAEADPLNARPKASAPPTAEHKQSETERKAEAAIAGRVPSAVPLVISLRPTPRPNSALGRLSRAGGAMSARYTPNHPRPPSSAAASARYQRSSTRMSHRQSTKRGSAASPSAGPVVWGEKHAEPPPPRPAIPPSVRLAESFRSSPLPAPLPAPLPFASGDPFDGRVDPQQLALAITRLKS